MGPPPHPQGFIIRYLNKQLIFSSSPTKALDFFVPYYEGSSPGRHVDLLHARPNWIVCFLFSRRRRDQIFLHSISRTSRKKPSVEGICKLQPKGLMVKIGVDTFIAFGDVLLGCIVVPPARIHRLELFQKLQRNV
jgi:hypothetical protein